MQIPPPAIMTALTRAAMARNVPWTVLAAIAFRESNYNASARGAAGELGLMQLMPATAERFGIVNPLDAAQSADGAAQFIKHLCAATDWNWRRCFYAYNMGAAKLAQLENDGKPIPRTVVAYADGVLANRYWLQHVVKPSGGREWERLNAAINGLARWTTEAGFISHQQNAVMDLQQRWSQNYVETVRTLTANRSLLEYPIFRDAWQRYAALYDHAEITDADTPHPDTIAPSLWAEIVDRVYPAATHQVSTAYGHPAPAAGGGGFMFVIAAGVALAIMSGRGRR